MSYGPTIGYTITNICMQFYCQQKCFFKQTSICLLNKSCMEFENDNINIATINSIFAWCYHNEASRAQHNTLWCYEAFIHNMMKCVCWACFDWKNLNWIHVAFDVCLGYVILLVMMTINWMLINTVVVGSLIGKQRFLEARDINQHHFPLHM